MFGGIKKIWRMFGPGLITGAADNDPAGITTYAVAGSQTGYATLWTMLFILPLMIAIQEMAARIGALSGCGLAGNIKRYYPKWLLAITALSIVLANIFNIGADIYGMSASVQLLVPLPPTLMAIIVCLSVLALVIFLRYRQIVRIFKWLSLTLLAYVLAFFLIYSDGWQILLHAFIPTIHFNKHFIILLFALMGTTISPYLYFWQASEEAEEERIKQPHSRVCRYRVVSNKELEKIDFDTKSGMFFSNVISFFIIALIGSTLFGQGGTVTTLRDAAEALRPLAGPYAYLLFTLGIFGSGILAIPVLAGSAGYVLAELFNWKGSLNYTFSQAKEFYVIIILSVLFGLVIPFLGITAVQALVYSALFNGLISPLLIFLIIHMARNPAIVGPNQSHPAIHYLGHATFLLMTVGSIVVLFF